ncbi:acetolactate decarboxylase [Pseudodesulfovibrio sp. zrk46]|uniref:acetolactate decarboxylase n=1 Tax=Pseudodesulfovibrio sp. zrk46 TaxID=2725288 RepID=UPI0014490282|nr:acetolactate decarboxylase [Pseudodesulfovibrio sp. zrk46]QJB56331.1 acetolactate decarboxylase [Pseudodesulfovibrio sp. zrk46]
MQRNRKPSFFSTLILTPLLLVFLCAPSLAGDTLFQYSTIDALLAGLYDGKMTVEQLKFKGDFGLGTLNGINGELILLEGQAYNAAPGGHAATPDDQSLIPFGAVAFFRDDANIEMPAITSMAELNKQLLKRLPSENLFYAIRIDADFPTIKTRAIAKQQPPYKPLAEVVKQQVVVNLSGKGTLVGIYSPPFVKGVGVPGFHWHFLTEDRSKGGHVLDLAMATATAQVDTLNDFTVRLPKDGAYDKLDLTGDKSKELHAVEKDTEHKQ